VRPGENGLVTAPDPASLAAACAELAESASLAERLGARGREDVRALSWSKVVEKLVMV
jgi:glycosyltransferase involved in cell wall biosynthesis